MIEIKLNKFKMINIFRLSEEKILKTLNDFKFLENIYINKVIPSTININLSKTNIIGKTTRNRKKFYIGENENFINFDQLSENINVPSIFGDFKIKEYIELQTILSVHQIDLKMIEKYYFYKNKRWDLFFHNGITLMLPSKNVQQSLKIFNKLLYNGNLANVRIIDLRVRNQVILTNYNE